MSIDTVGAVYCPLSPRDPKQRIQALVKQVQSRLILIHWQTRDIFEDDCDAFDIDEAINADHSINNTDFDQLSNVSMTSESLAYALFTSGSTGMPKT
ncbi:unnamed protein product, partial [Rotaria sp. Silwood2]